MINLHLLKLCEDKGTIENSGKKGQILNSLSCRPEKNINQIDQADQLKKIEGEKENDNNSGENI